MQVIVCGAGIGGLSAALSLAQQGFSVRVLEQAGHLGEVGAGIQLSPNCTRVLFDLGLEAALREIAFIPRGVEMRGYNNGRVLSASELGDAVLASTGFPYFHVHRADLINVLADAVRSQANIELRTATEVVSLQPDAVSPRVVTASGETFVADVLVGADGIRSAVRESLFGPQPANFTGNVAWRALVPVDRLPPNQIRPMATAWWGPGAHFVHYYVRGGELVNCVCVIEQNDWTEESWTTPGDLDELRRAFAGWHPDIGTLIEQADADSLFKWGLFDRDPLPQWGRSCVTLLGDACHPTLPFMAQGAAMAIEDGAVLVRCLRAAPDPASVPDALTRYANLRRQRTAAVQAGSRRNARVFHLSGPAAWARNLALRIRPPKAPMAALFSYNALTAHESG